MFITGSHVLFVQICLCLCVILLCSSVKVSARVTLRVPATGWFALRLRPLSGLARITKRVMLLLIGPVSAANMMALVLRHNTHPQTQGQKLNFCVGFSVSVREAIRLKRETCQVHKIAKKITVLLVLTPALCKPLHCAS